MANLPGYENYVEAKLYTKRAELPIGVVFLWVTEEITWSDIPIEARITQQHRLQPIYVDHEGYVTDGVVIDFTTLFWN